MSTWGIVPAAGLGSRIQPLAFSKELLPVGSRARRRDGASQGGLGVPGRADDPRRRHPHLHDHLAGQVRHRRVLRRRASGRRTSATWCSREPRGLCDALFRALPLIGAGDQVLVGLPDTVWFPEDGFRRLGEETLSFLLFPVERPELFDAVVTDRRGAGARDPGQAAGAPSSSWIWGAFRMPGRVLHDLHALWRERGGQDVYVGTLVNEWLARGGEARGVRAGEAYVDVGTLHGYREAIQLLENDGEVSGVIEAVKLWNEPNNKSHWDFEIDPEWRMFARMAMPGRGRGARRERHPHPRPRRHVADRRRVRAEHEVAGGARPRRRRRRPRLPARLEPLADRRVAGAAGRDPGADPPPGLGDRGGGLDLRRRGGAGVRPAAHRRAPPRPSRPRIHWYSLYDLPRAWPATTRHREAEGSSYYRHFYMGILREDGTPKLSLKHFADFTPELGICQWFHFEDPRLDDAVRWLRKLGVQKLRTGLSWADSFRPGADAWFDRQMKALDEFDVTLTYCFTPEHRGLQPHHTSPPQVLEEYADFCARMTRRYA